MAAVNTDNFVSDFLVNTKIILEENRSLLGIKKIYDEDVAIVDALPSIALSVVGLTIDRRSLGSVNARFEVDIVGELWYYREQMLPDTRKNEIMKNAWKIVSVLQTNATLNAWLLSTRSYVRSCNWAIRRNSNLLLAGARILLVARKQTRFTIT